MTTFEIINLAKEIEKINDGDDKQLMTWVDGRNVTAKIEILTDEDGYWRVYADDNYISTQSVYSMMGAIAEVIDEIKKYVDFKDNLAA